MNPVHNRVLSCIKNTDKSNEGLKRRVIYLYNIDGYFLTGFRRLIDENMLDLK